MEVKKRDLQTKLNREVEEQKRVEKDNHPETKMTRYIIPPSLWPQEMKMLGDG